MKTILLALLLISSPFAHASDEIKCRSVYNPQLQSVVLSNRALTSAAGDALPLPCIEYFMNAAKKETLPRIGEKSVPLILDLLISQNDLMPSIERILGESPRTRTSVTLKFYLNSDPQGMNDLKATLDLKPVKQ